MKKMNSISVYIFVVASAWLVSQSLKYVITSLKNRSFKKNFRQFYLSGNMPSAHSATVIALLTTIGIKDGVDTALFGLATLFSAVVMYDAMMVRRSSGEQGKALTELIKESKSNIMLPRVAKGHSPIEVLAGAVVGILVALVVILITS